MKSSSSHILLAIAALLPLAALRADVQLPAIISDHMVLKKSPRTSIWGVADVGEKVTVTLGRQASGTVADAEGKWKIALNLEKSTPGPFALTVTGKNRIVILDVMVGEVWVASGQSNMEWLLMNTIGAKDEIARSNNPQIRQFQVLPTSVPLPTDTFAGKWMVASARTSGGFSSVGYYFAKNLQDHLKMPVGIIDTSWGDTPVEAWMSREAIDSIPDLKAAADKQRASPDDINQPPGSTRRKALASGIYNGMIYPLLPYTISGVIWYQGEKNASRAWQYRMAFPALINDWRAHWAQGGEFPFFFCQLAGFGEKSSAPTESSWAELREAQSTALSLPHTGQIVLIDIGEGGEIHPRNKKPVGDRLAALALENTYGKVAVSSGPVFESATIEGRKIRVQLAHTEGGLIATPIPETYLYSTRTNQTRPLIRNSPGSELEGFAICGEDKRWTWANAVIDGNSVIVWSETIAKPVAVRYGWANNPICNLFNAKGLPAAPFRTDEFPAATQKIKYQ